MAAPANAYAERRCKWWALLILPIYQFARCSRLIFMARHSLLASHHTLLTCTTCQKPQPNQGIHLLQQHTRCSKKSEEFVSMKFSPKNRNCLKQQNSKLDVIEFFDFFSGLDTKTKHTNFTWDCPCWCSEQPLRSVSGPPCHSSSVWNYQTIDAFS